MIEMITMGESAVTEKQTEETKKELYVWIATLVCVVVATVLIFTFVARIIRVDGESMRETLHDQDILLVLADPLCGEYRAGDIVVLSKATFEGGVPIIKRVVATEGQTVDIDFAAGIVYVDGEVLEEDYIREPTWTPEGLEFPVTIPEDHVFVLGDNRNNSSDSRHIDLGPIDEQMMIGKAVLLVIPGKTAELDAREWSRLGRIG